MAAIHQAPYSRAAPGQLITRVLDHAMAVTYLIAAESAPMLAFWISFRRVDAG
jgi:hypothetical protein